MTTEDTEAQMTVSISALAPFLTYDDATAIAFTTAAISTRILAVTWAVARWAARATWTLTLVAIGLAFFAIELWQDRIRVKAAMVLAAQKLKRRAKAQYWLLCLTGAMVLRRKVVSPAREMEVRSRVAFRMMTRGIS